MKRTAEAHLLSSLRIEDEMIKGPSTLPAHLKRVLEPEAIVHP